MTININSPPKSRRPDVSPIARLNKMSDKCPFCHLPSTKSMTDRGTCLTSYDNHFQKWVRGPDCYQRQIANLAGRLEDEKELWQETMNSLQKAMKEVFELRADKRELQEKLAAWREWHKSVWGRDATEDYLRKGNKLYNKLQELKEV